MNPDINTATTPTTHLDTFKHLMNLILEYLVKYSFQALGGIIVLFLGWLVARYAAAWTMRLLERKHIDITISKFIVGAVKLVVMAFAVIVALGKFGIEIAPLIAGISVVGFGTSFALQGPLSNYASGATLIFTKPFKVGDIIEVAGVVGEVTDMKLPRTEIKTVDGHTIVIPNKHIVGEVIHNYSDAKGVDLTIGVSYKSDVQKAIEIIRTIVADDARVIKEKSPKIGIAAFADSSVTIMARFWAKQDDYYDVMFGVNKKILETFKAQGIDIPFPQRDVHLYKEESS